VRIIQKQTLGFVEFQPKIKNNKKIIKRASILKKNMIELISYRTRFLHLVIALIKLQKGKYVIWRTL